MSMVCSKSNFDGAIPAHAPELGPCWEYGGYLNESGYGRAVDRSRKSILVHRLSYVYFKGPIPGNLPLDHLCRNRKCFNPGHLEAVTHAENQRRGFSPWGINARKTHCKNGHEFTLENTFEQYNGGRGCVTCRDRYFKEYQLRDEVKKKVALRRLDPDRREKARLRAAEWYRNNRSKATLSSKEYYHTEKGKEVRLNAQKKYRSKKKTSDNNC